MQCQSLSGKELEPQTGVFPILKTIDADTTQMVGTGFFITNIGHFVTAKHVIEDVYDFNKKKQLSQIHAVHFVNGAQILVRHITKIFPSLISDLVIGKMDFHIVNDTGLPLYNSVPIFTTTPPPKESSVVTFAYPCTDKIHRRGVKGKFVAGEYEGKLIKHSETPRDTVLVSWPYYETSIDVKGGASGGPVYDYQGRVIGVNCVSGLGTSYMARTKELLELRVPEHPFNPSGHRDGPTVIELIHKGAIKFVT